MRVYKAATALALMIAGTAQAGLFSEVESNNTLGTANDLGSFSAPGGSVIIDGVIEQGDVDWFQFTLTDTASISVFAGFSFSDGADGILQVVADGGDVIGFDDDSGVGFMPALQIADLAAGTYFVGMSGFGDVGSGSVDSDDLASGDHSQNFGYKLNIGFTIVPAPSAMALLGMGGLVMTRRRR